VVGFYVPFAELGVETFEEFDVVLREFQAVLLCVSFETKKPLVLRKEVVPLPDSANGPRSDMNASKKKLLTDSEASLCRELQRVLEDRFLQLRCNSVGMRILGPAGFFQKAFGPEGLEVSSDFIELLP